MEPKLVIVGAGGHARVLAEIVQLSGGWQLAGFTDTDPKLKDTRVLNAPVLGTDEILEGLRSQGIEKFVIGVGSTKNNGQRSMLYRKVLQVGLEPVSLIHPSAILSPSAEVGRGTVILARAVLNSGAKIGENVIVNTGAIIEHDCVIGDHCHVASGACLSGGVRVGPKSFIGAGATVIQNIRIGRACLIGAGAAVVCDIPDLAQAFGVPAQVKVGKKEPSWKASL